MNKRILVFMGILFLSGCSYAKDTLSVPPTIKWDIPETIDANTDVSMSLSISTNNQNKWNEDDMTLTLRKQGDEESIDLPFEPIGPEKIEVNTSFSTDGVYYIQSTLKTENYTIQPIRQIVVGDAEKVEIKKDNQDSQDHGDHH